MCPMRRSTRLARHAGCARRESRSTHSRHAGAHGATIGATYVQDTLGLDGDRHRHRGRRFRSWRRGTTDLGSNRVVKFVGTSSAFNPRRTTTTDTARTSPDILAGSGYDSGGPPPRHRAGHDAARREGPRRVWTGLHQQTSSRPSTMRSPTRPRSNLRVIQPVGGGRRVRVVQRRPADAGGQARRRSGTDRRVGRRKSRRRRRRPGTVRRESAHRAMHRGVITVGASSHNGTSDRADDIVASFSSRGPSAIDFQANPISSRRASASSRSRKRAARSSTRNRSCASGAPCRRPPNRTCR